MHMVMLVLDNPDLLDEVLESWRALGIAGATIVESTGTYRRQRIKAGRLPTRFNFQQSVEVTETGNFTVFAIVLGEETARACLAATESVVGNLDDPNTGVFAAWPLSIIKGVPGSGSAAGDDA